jgi:hypothetical protein
MRRLLLLLCVAALLAAGSAAAAPPKLNGDAVGQVVQLLGKMAGVVKHDHGNCSKMASDLKAFNAANRGTIHALNATGASLTKMQSLMVGRQYVAYAQQIAQSVSTISTGLVSCYSNTALQAALKSLGQ